MKLIGRQPDLFMNRIKKKSRAATQALDVIYFFFIIEKINPLPNDTQGIHYRYFGFILKISLGTHQ